jgi:hypothetical protein
LPEDTQPNRVKSFLPQNSTRETSKKTVVAVAPKRTKISKKEVIPDSEAEDTEPPTRTSLSPLKRTPTRDIHSTEIIQEEQSSSLIEKVTKGWTSLFGKDKKKEKSTPSNLGASHSNPLEIDESPQKQDQQMKNIAQDPANPPSKSVNPEVNGSRPISRDSPPFTKFSQNTPSPQLDDDFNSGDEIEVPSSPGLHEPIMNGSDSRTFPDEGLSGSDEINHEDQEMLFSANASSSKQRSGTKLNRSSPPPTPRIDSPRKRAHSEASGPRKKGKHEVSRAVNVDEGSPMYVRTEKTQRATSRAISHGVEQQLDGAADTYQPPSWGPPLKRISQTGAGEHTKFED